MFDELSVLVVIGEGLSRSFAGNSRPLLVDIDEPAGLGRGSRLVGDMALRFRRCDDRSRHCRSRIGRSFGAHDLDPSVLRRTRPPGPQRPDRYLLDRGLNLSTDDSRRSASIHLRWLERLAAGAVPRHPPSARPEGLLRPKPSTASTSSQRRFVARRRNVPWTKPRARTDETPRGAEPTSRSVMRRPRRARANCAGMTRRNTGSPGEDRLHLKPIRAPSQIAENPKKSASDEPRRSHCRQHR